MEYVNVFLREGREPERVAMGLEDRRGEGSRSRSGDVEVWRTQRWRLSTMRWWTVRKSAPMMGRETVARMKGKVNVLVPKVTQIDWSRVPQVGIGVPSVVVRSGLDGRGCGGMRNDAAARTSVNQKMCPVMTSHKQMRLNCGCDGPPVARLLDH